jgi:hypothetical protein
MEMPTQKGWLWRLEVGSPTVSVRLLMVLTHHDQHRRGRLTSNIAPDLQERLLAEATRGLATAGVTPEPVIELTRDEANHATPVCWLRPLVVPRPLGEARGLQRRRVPGVVRTSVVSSWTNGASGALTRR